MQKTTLATPRHQTGQRPPRRLNKLTYASAGGKTYDAGVVARAKENARNAQNFEYVPTDKEKREEEELEARLHRNANRLTRLRLQVMELTNGKTQLAPKPRRKGSGSSRVLRSASPKRLAKVTTRKTRKVSTTGRSSQTMR